MVARLLGQNQKLVSASFAKLQFWTGDKWQYLMNQKYSNGCMLLDLRVCQGGLPVEKVIMDIGATKMVVAVQILKLDQNGNEVDPLKFLKEHK